MTGIFFASIIHFNIITYLYVRQLQACMLI